MADRAARAATLPANVKNLLNRWRQSCMRDRCIQFGIPHASSKGTHWRTQLTLRTLVAMACLATALLAGERQSAVGQDRTADWNTWLPGEASGFSGVVLIGRDDLIDVAAAFG